VIRLCVCFRRKGKKKLCKSNKRRNNKLMTVVTNCRLSKEGEKYRKKKKKERKRNIFLVR